MQEKIKQLRLQGKGYGVIAKELNISKSKAKYYSHKLGLTGVMAESNNQYGNLKDREKEFKERFEKKYPKFKYHSEFINMDSYFNMECQECGNVQSKSAICMRPWRDKELQCDNCNELLKTRKALIGVIKKKILETNKQIDKQIKEIILPEVEALQRIGNNHSHYLECEECGKTYFSTRKRYTCSHDCMVKRHNRIKEIKRRKRILKNGDIDWDITLPKLIKRDSNTCYMCGKKCDSNDYILRVDGTHIAGNNYPSIDHVIPVAKGGTHTWDNIRLAHRGCNSKKNSKRVYIKQSGQVTLAL